MAKAKTVTEEKTISIPAQTFETVQLTLVGVGEGLLCHRFADPEAALKKGGPKDPSPRKEARDFDAEFEASRYIHNGKDCFPSSGIKKAMVEACGFTDGIFKTTARGSFFVMGEYAPIVGPAAEMHKSVVFIGGRSRIAVLRIRALYRNWKMPVEIRYDTHLTNREQLAFLLQQAGFSIGVGDFRPAKGGSFGMFAVGGSENGNGSL